VYTIDTFMLQGRHLSFFPCIGPLMIQLTDVCNLHIVNNGLFNIILPRLPNFLKYNPSIQIFKMKCLHLCLPYARYMPSQLYIHTFIQPNDNN
jgi:hypothetical protein